MFLAEKLASFSFIMTLYWITTVGYVQCWGDSSYMMNPCIALRTDSHFIDRETEALRDFKLSQDCPVIEL